jgi:transcriptional regulator with XRE-family HTH domain
MDIAQRLRELREAKDLSQGDIEAKTGLFRCYISRVENGHTVPALETLEKMARALEIPLYGLFYEGENPPAVEKAESGPEDWATRGKGLREFTKFRRALAKMSERNRATLLDMAAKITSRKPRKKA